MLPRSNHINNPALQSLMEDFMREYPNGDSLELARYMYNRGFEAARPEYEENHLP